MTTTQSLMLMKSRPGLNDTSRNQPVRIITRIFYNNVQAFFYKKVVYKKVVLDRPKNYEKLVVSTKLQKLRKILRNYLRNLN